MRTGHGYGRGSAALAGVLALCAAATPAAAGLHLDDGAPVTVSELVIEGAKTVSELTVTAQVKCLAPDRMPERAQRPRVVDSWPRKGAVVRPGLLVVRVTFDRPMACAGVFAANPPRMDPCPGTPREMVLSYDRRTVRTVCLVSAGTSYGLALSQDPNAGGAFMGLAGLPSLPYRLDFVTAAGPPVATVCEALTEDDVTARQIRARRPLDCGAKGAPPATGG